MSIPSPPKKVKLVIGVFLQDKELIVNIANKLEENWGAVDIVSPWFVFNYTNYYEKEMGDRLFRRMFAFKELIDIESLADIKLTTNAIEKRYLIDGKRRANIDPGYLAYEKLVLATGKNYSHRIYIGKGIYADLTLMYTKGGFNTLPWTYPDYAQEDIISFLQKVRSKYCIDGLTGKRG